MRRAPSSDPELIATELRVVIGRLSRRLHEEAGSLSNLSRAEGSLLRRLEATGSLLWQSDASADEVERGFLDEDALGALVAAGLARLTLTSRGDHWCTLSYQARVQLARNRLAREDWLFRAVQTCLNAAQQRELAQFLVLLRRLADAP